MCCLRKFLLWVLLIGAGAFAGYMVCERQQHEAQIVRVIMADKLQKEADAFREGLFVAACRQLYPPSRLNSDSEQACIIEYVRMKRVLRIFKKVGRLNEAFSASYDHVLLQVEPGSDGQPWNVFFQTQKAGALAWAMRHGRVDLAYLLMHFGAQPLPGEDLPIAKFQELFKTLDFDAVGVSDSDDAMYSQWEALNLLTKPTDRPQLGSFEHAVKKQAAFDSNGWMAESCKGIRAYYGL